MFRYWLSRLIASISLVIISLAIVVVFVTPSSSAQSDSSVAFAGTLISANSQVTATISSGAVKQLVVILSSNVSPTATSTASNHPKIKYCVQPKNNGALMRRGSLGIGWNSSVDRDWRTFFTQVVAEDGAIEKIKHDESESAIEVLGLVLELIPQDPWSLAYALLQLNCNDAASKLQGYRDHFDTNWPYTDCILASYSNMPTGRGREIEAASLPADSRSDAHQGQFNPPGRTRIDDRPLLPNAVGVNARYGTRDVTLP